MEEVIHEELQYFCQALTMSGGSVIDISELLSHALSNVISAVVFGKRFKYLNGRFSHWEFAGFLRVSRLAKLLPFIKVISLQYICPLFMFLEIAAKYSNMLSYNGEK